MDFKKFKDENIEHIVESTFESQISLEPEHITKYAQPMRKLFNRSAVKQDMNDFVSYMLKGYAYFDTDILKMCFDNGASKEFKADELGVLIVALDDDQELLKKIVSQNKSVLNNEMNEVLKGAWNRAYYYDSASNQAIDNCFQFGLPHKDIAEIKTYNDATNIFIENYAENDIVLKYVELNAYKCLNNADSVEQLLENGITPKEIIKISNDTMTWISDDSFDLLWKANPRETNVLSMQVAIESFYEDVLDGTIDRINSKGVIPIVDDDIFISRNEHQPITFKLVETLEQNELLDNNQKQIILTKAISSNDKKLVDYMIEKGAKIDDECMKEFGIADENGNTYRQFIFETLESSNMLKHLIINHKYEPTEFIKERLEPFDSYNQLIGKKELNTSLQEKLNFKMDDSQHRPTLSKKMKQQGMKI